jgi:hypothetical protein
MHGLTDLGASKGERDMDRIEPAMFTRQKKLKKLIKLIEGQESAPANHKSKLETRISSLSTELGTGDLNELKTQFDELNLKLGKPDTTLDPDHAKIITQTRSWYLRPLISHFDSPKKVKALASNEEGLGGLRNEIELYLPQEFWSDNSENVYSSLNFYFQFKSLGKGKSKNLETEFYNHFKLSDQPQISGGAIGKNRLPYFHYNLDNFTQDLSSGKKSILVTGLCPMSGISNELRFVSSSGEHWQPELGFESLPLPADDFEFSDILFPSRPILSDYITIKNFVEVLGHYAEIIDTDQFSGLIWYPHTEYIIDFTELIFTNWIDAGIVTKSQINDEFNKLETRYKKLVEAVTGLEGFNGKLEFRSTRTEDIDEFERIVDGIDLGHIKHIYGIWSGAESRLKLYIYLIIKHILPSLTGNNVLHLETSYELWPNVQGSKLVEATKDAGMFSWMCFPSTPSLSMSHMRDYNAPFNDKLYLADPIDVFKQKVRHLTRNYITYVSPQMFNFDDVTEVSQDTLRTLFTEKVIEINNELTS